MLVDPFLSLRGGPAGADDAISDREKPSVAKSLETLNIKGTMPTAEAACSDGVTAAGKQSPVGPPGSRQGKNDYTAWFDGDPDMGGDYLGYDGPCPPWNDSIVHHYHFVLYATDLERCPVEGRFTGPEVEAAIAGHVLEETRITGTYTLNPSLGG